MKLTPYATIIKMAKDAKDALLAPLRANEMKKKAELEMAQIDSKVMEHESRIQELCSAYPISFDSLIKAIDERSLLERRKKQFEKIVEEMFP